MQCILSELVRQDRMVIVESFDVETPKTKAFVAKLKEYDLSSVLIVGEEISENLYMASRNVPKVSLCDVNTVGPLNLIASDKVLFTVAAIKKLEEQFS